MSNTHAEGAGGAGSVENTAVDIISFVDTLSPDQLATLQDEVFRRTRHFGLVGRDALLDHLEAAKRAKGKAETALAGAEAGVAQAEQELAEFDRAAAVPDVPSEG